MRGTGSRPWLAVARLLLLLSPNAAVGGCAHDYLVDRAAWASLRQPRESQTPRPGAIYRSIGPLSVWVVPLGDGRYRVIPADASPDLAVLELSEESSDAGAVDRVVIEYARRRVAVPALDARTHELVDLLPASLPPVPGGGDEPWVPATARGKNPTLGVGIALAAAGVGGLVVGAVLQRQADRCTVPPGFDLFGLTALGCDLEHTRAGAVLALGAIVTLVGAIVTAATATRYPERAGEGGHRRRLPHAPLPDGARQSPGPPAGPPPTEGSTPPP